MRFDFEGHVVIFIKSHDARVVLKDTHTPIIVTQIGANLHRRGKDRFFEHRLVFDGSVFVGVRDPAGQCFMTAVLRPSLGHRFEFNIGRVTIKRFKMSLNGLHLDQRQRQLPLLADLYQLIIGRGSNGNRREFELVSLS